MRHLDKMPKLSGQKNMILFHTQNWKNSIHKWFFPCIDEGRKTPRDRQKF